MKCFVMAAALCATAAIAQANPSNLTPTSVDHMIRAEWAKEKIVPSPPVDDARFLRRIYLDITGTIPPAGEVSAFLADKSPDKRAKAIDALLNSPRYAENWTNYWDNVLMGRQVRAQLIDRTAWRSWLHGQFNSNAHWNKFVYDLISASGVNSKGGPVRLAAGLKMPADRFMEMDSADSTGVAGRVNGAVNWTLKYLQTPADLSGAASKIFLGVQIQCAQCHDHKTEKWKQDDFRKFTACFMSAVPRPVGGNQQGMIRQLNLVDMPRQILPRRGMMAKAAQGRAEYMTVQPAALDGTEFTSSSRRQQLAEWMTRPENPWFAEAIVNRMWSHFMGRGFVEPIDDFRTSNPAVMPELLKKLADDFVAHDYDLKQLIKTITSTQVYQLSSAPAKKIDAENKLWARYRLKPMQPEVMLDSVIEATNLGKVLDVVAGGNVDALRFQLNRQFSFLFDVDEENEQKGFEGTIPQALMLLNGTLVNKSVSPIPGTALAETLAMPGGDAGKIEALYLRTLSRKPTSAELNRWMGFVNQARDLALTDGPPVDLGPARRRIMQNAGAQRRGVVPDPLARANRFDNTRQTPKQQAYEDLFWALLNSSEFMFNH